MASRCDLLLQAIRRSVPCSPLDVGSASWEIELPHRDIESPKLASPWNTARSRRGSSLQCQTTGTLAPFRGTPTALTSSHFGHHALLICWQPLTRWPSRVLGGRIMQPNRLVKQVQEIHCGHSVDFNHFQVMRRAIADSGSTQTSGRRSVYVGKSGQMPGQRRRRDWKRIQRGQRGSEAGRSSLQCRR